MEFLSFLLEFPLVRSGALDIFLLDLALGFLLVIGSGLNLSGGPSISLDFTWLNLELELVIFSRFEPSYSDV